ncbi:MAG TPA: hypothetical protein VK888_11065, partial [Anaerolineales bacterium]|nr:hypothetical protein [Anaerolineales bacterium]
MDIFTVIYVVAILIEILIRIPLNKKRKLEKMSERRVTRQEKTLLGLLSLAMFFVPIIDGASDWLDFADYALPAWAGWLGVVLI